MEKMYKLGGHSDVLSLEQIRRLVDSGKYMPVHKNIVRDVKGGRILDLGCGIGNFSYQLSKIYPSAKITGIDDADYSIDVARALYGNTSNLTFELMDGTNLKFHNQDFDTACFLEVIEHLEDPVKALKEINRILKTGGELILSTNNVYYSRFLFRQIIHGWFKRKPKLMIHINEKWGKHFFAWDISTLCTLLNQYGFEYVSHFYVGCSGFYLRETVFDKWMDAFFGKIFPFFRATVVIKLKKS